MDEQTFKGAALLGAALRFSEKRPEGRSQNFAGAQAGAPLQFQPERSRSAAGAQLLKLL